MQIIDTHLHLVYLDRFRYPWLDSDPNLNRTFTIDEYLAQASSAGITKMLHMEVDVAEADIERETRFALGVGRGVVGAISACRPESAEFPAFLERSIGAHGVRGFRRVFHTGAHEAARTPIFKSNLKLLSKHNKTFDLCFWPRHIPIAAELAKACPDVQFVLDHCGIPNIRERELDPWRNHILDIAALPNVACKISGVIAYGDPVNWTVNDLRPYVEHAIESFGWDRVVWGSDWPVCTVAANLGRWVAATHALLEGTSEDEKERIFERNARRIYSINSIDA
jgi:predicted TIM-barrel fold metal-dependent hydrolase